MQASPLWKAVHLLREAEALTGLGNVAGPTDAPPSSPEDEDSWARDWLQRGRDALDRARKMHEEAKRKGLQVLQDRASRVAGKLREGVQRVIQGARNVAKATKEQLQEFHQTARSAATAWASMNVLFTVAGIIAAVWYFTRK